MAETFEIWAGKRDVELATMLLMCRTILSDDSNVLSEQIRKAESWLCYFQLLLAEGNKRLSQAESQAAEGVRRAESLPAYDRELKVDAICSPEQEMADKLEGLIDSLKTRISLGQTLIKVFQERLQRG